jgi:hypothetical protein
MPMIIATAIMKTNPSTQSITGRQGMRTKIKAEIAANKQRTTNGKIL